MYEYYVCGGVVTIIQSTTTTTFKGLLFSGGLLLSRGRVVVVVSRSGRINRRNVSCVVRATHPRTVSAEDRYEFLNIQSIRLHLSTL